jgi:hypothetical protein
MITSQSRFRRFFHAQLRAWRALLGPAKPLGDLLRAPPERPHPSQLCRCFQAGLQVDHQPDCAWMAMRCRACSGVGRCTSCGGDGVDPAALPVDPSGAGVVHHGSDNPWGDELDETRICNASARLAAADPASVTSSEPRVKFDLSDAGPRR